MKRLLPLICLLLFAVRAFAYDFSSVTTDAPTAVTLYYEINSDEKSVTLTYGEERYEAPSITIPATVTYKGKSYAVTAIGHEAFHYANVGHVIMANSITEVQSSAFSDSHTPNVTFSKGLKHIREYAFRACDLSAAELHEGLETIGRNAFCPKSIGNIDYMSRLTLPNSVTEIGESAFAYQRKLTEVNIPASLKELKNDVFADCDGLKSVTFHEGLEKIGDGVFEKCALTTIDLPSTVRYVGANAFSATNVTEVILKDNLTFLGDNVFSNCAELQRISFPASIKAIPKNACGSCGKLTEVTIADGITSLGYGAFSGCKLLSHITLPESVNEVGASVFSQTGLTSFKFPQNLKELPLAMFSDCNHLQEITLPSSVTSIDRYLFRNCGNLKRVVLSDNITAIPDGCFDWCNTLTDVELPAQLKSIEENAFSRCEALEVLDIPKGLVTLGDYAFQYCSKLKQLTLPKTLEEIGQSVFYNIGDFSLHLNRAIPPRCIGPALSPNLFSPDNNCTLYVPTGSSATYKAYGNNFYNAKEIVEENVDGQVVYQVTAQVEGNGNLRVGETTLNWNERAEVPMGETLTLDILPAEDYHLVSLSANGKDVTKDVADNRYVIEEVGSNVHFEATFAINPYTLYLKASEQGQMGIPVERGSMLKCAIVAEEGWKVNTIFLDYTELTDDLADDGTISVKPTYDKQVLRVSFEKTTGISSIGTSSMAAYANSAGELIVKGVERGISVQVFNAEGQKVSSFTATGTENRLKLPSQGVYIVATDTKSVKVIY